MSVGATSADPIETQQAFTVDVSMFSNLTKTLGLQSNEQTYMIYMWLKYTMKITARREPEGGN